MKGEIKSRAKILTDEAFRKNRNYIENNEFGNEKTNKFFNEFNVKIAQRQDTLNEKVEIEKNVLLTAEIREMLNKISADNFEDFQAKILNIDYDEGLLCNLKNLLYAKAVNESNFLDLYTKIIFSLFKKFKSTENKAMNFKSLLLKTCQYEFENSNKTSIEFPFLMDEEEKHFRLKEGKIGNMHLICEFYMRKAVPLKIIKNCWLDLKKVINDLNVRIVVSILKKTYKKLYFEEISLLHELYDFCVKVRDDMQSNIASKTRFEIMDLIDLKNSGWGIQDEDQFLKAEIKEPELKYSRKGSIARKRSSMQRRSSIGIADIEKMKRSRFSSRADEIASTSKIDESDEIVDSLMKDLETDVSFYSYFKLTEDEAIEVKTPLKTVMYGSMDDGVKAFDESTESCDCEKFIAVGNYLEEMFEANIRGAEFIKSVIIYLLEQEKLTVKDIQHG